MVRVPSREAAAASSAPLGATFGDNAKRFKADLGANHPRLLALLDPAFVVPLALTIAAAIVIVQRELDEITGPRRIMPCVWRQPMQRLPHAIPSQPWHGRVQLSNPPCAMPPVPSHVATPMACGAHRCGRPRIRDSVTGNRACRVAIATRRASCHRSIRATAAASAGGPLRAAPPSALSAAHGASASFALSSLGLIAPLSRATASRDRRSGSYFSRRASSFWRWSE